MIRKVFHTITLLSFLSPLFGQVDLPDSLFVILYSGGDYRSEEYGKGSSSRSDSLCFVKQDDKYFLEKIVRTQKLFVYVSDDFSKSKNVNQDSTVTIYQHDYVDTTIVANLLRVCEMSRYTDQTFVDTIMNYKNDSYFVNDTATIKNNLNITDFDLSAQTLRTACHIYELQNDKKLPCQQIDIDNLLAKVIKRNRHVLFISSYVTWVNLSFEVKGGKFKLWQQYPGELNVRWSIEKPGNSTFNTLINPSINRYFSELLPKYMVRQYGLDEYKSAERWILLWDGLKSR